MKRLLAVAVALFLLFAIVESVSAVTHGQPDGSGHPYVGVAIQPIPSMPGFVTVCSGSALSPTKFLTASHCFDPNQPVFVTYKSGPPFNITNPANFSPEFTQGMFHPNPNWCLGCAHGLSHFDTNDVAVITLNSAVNLSGYATLPSAGLVDTLAQHTSVDVVGYGVQSFLHGGGKPQQVFLFTRYFAPTQLIASHDAVSGQFIKLQANPSQGTGGTCFGDSGGPDLLGGTNTILAVNSYVTNGNCAGVTYSNRVDLPDILSFINSF